MIIGSFQSLSNEVDLAAAERHGVTVVRRISGGGAMFVEPGNTITYSLYVPATLVEGMSFADSYAFLDAWVIRALRELGVDASYVPLNDIASPAGKIGGAAQKRLASGAVLHHVTMSYDMDAEKMLDIIRIGREKLSDKGIKSAVKRVDRSAARPACPGRRWSRRCCSTSATATAPPRPSSTRPPAPRPRNWPRASTATRSGWRAFRDPVAGVR